MQFDDDYFGTEFEEKAQEESAEIQLVSFLLGEEEFGADILMVQEIIRMQPITRVPNAPYFVEGVINLRGKVIPIVDLRKRLNLGEVEDTRKTRTIVVDIEGKNTGFIVDSVSQVLRIPKHTIEPPPSIVIADIESEYITGVSKLKVFVEEVNAEGKPAKIEKDRLLIILDFSKILTKREKKALQGVDEE
jgi:purine-binding chemotaxis protein CheW